MKLRWDKWLYGLGSAVIGGGSSAVVGGFVSVVAFKVDVTTMAGAQKIMAVMFANFAVAAFFSLFFYLKQDPLPSAVSSDSDPAAFVRQPQPNPEPAKAGTPNAEETTI